MAGVAAVAQFVASFAGRFGAFFIITQKIITLFFFLLLRGLAKQKRRCVDMVNRSVTFMMIAASVKALKTTQHR